MFNLNSIVNSLFSGNDKKKIGEFSKIAKDIIDSSGLNFHSAVEFKEAADKVQKVLETA